ncbi:unnamed protein product, partial [Prorocentrum cordatum]
DDAHMDGPSGVESNTVAMCTKALRALRSICDDKRQLALAARAELAQAEAERCKLRAKVDKLTEQLQWATEKLHVVKQLKTYSNAPRPRSRSPRAVPAAVAKLPSQE